MRSSFSKCTKNGQLKGSSFPVSYNEKSYTVKMRSPSPNELSSIQMRSPQNLFIKTFKMRNAKSSKREVDDFAFLMN